MNKRIFWLLLLLPSFLFAQKGVLEGKVLDYATNEPVIGAYVFISNEFRVKSDLDGSYYIGDIPYGTYQVRVSMFSYDTIIKTIKIDQPAVVYNFTMGDAQEIEEVQVIGQLAVDRKTPVAVSKIDAKQLTEELGSRDLPMILNTTPGVIATEQGGGDGDARISIRGFDQRNVGVMIDGVPVNDMENGTVYWSNWFGLDQITDQIQVQRGLGATKLAMPSVGGTMNIITSPTGGKRSIKVQQEYGIGNFSRTSFTYKSGKLKNGWGVLLSGSYKRGDGLIDGLYTNGGFYYAKIQKKIGDHLISLSGFGAPQEHGQRSYRQRIEYWDKSYAEKLGVEVPADTDNIDHGRYFNEHWGYYTDIDGSRKTRSERRNYYHKPQITLKDFWKVNEKLSFSNMVYTSIGKGGGERLRNTGGIIKDENGLVDWDKIVQNNQEGMLFGQLKPTVDPAYSPTLLKSGQVSLAAVNNHIWIGGISQFDYDANDYWKISAGLDYRWYRGTHYYELLDLLGGDYWVNNFDQNASTPMKVEGDVVGWQPYHAYRDALVQWAGAFAQAEYAKDRWTTFMNVSTVMNGYKGIDYSRKREAHLADTVLYIGGTDVIKYNDVYYHPNSKDLEYNQTDWKWEPGFTVKTGANYNLTERSNVFINAGFLSRTPQYSTVINDEKNEFFQEIMNEQVMAVEGGYGFRSKKISFNVNAYYTYWKNKPFPFGLSLPDPEDPGEYVKVNINGMDARHMGIEFDGAYKILPNLTFEAMISIGDWAWQSAKTVDVLGTQFTFDAKGVHVGDAPQQTYAASIRYEPIKKLYVKAQYTYAAKYYSNFDPFSLDVTGPNARKDSWKIPSFGLLSFYTGYRFQLEKSSINLRGSIFNALDTIYISDATNNDGASGFDAASAKVFIGQGFRFNLTLGFEF